MYCSKCGAKMEDGASFCTECGAPVAGAPASANGNPANQYDSGSFGWLILGFFIPLAGLILWLVWKEDRPKSASMAGIGALASVIFNVLLTIVILIAVMTFGSFSYSSSTVLSGLLG